MNIKPEIEAELNRQAKGYLDRQISWREVLINSYTVEVAELKRKRSVMDDEAAEIASAERTLSDTQEFTPVTATPASMRGVRRGAA